MTFSSPRCIEQCNNSAVQYKDCKMKAHILLCVTVIAAFGLQLQVSEALQWQVLSSALINLCLHVKDESSAPGSLLELEQCILFAEGPRSRQLWSENWTDGETESTLTYVRTDTVATSGGTEPASCVVMDPERGTSDQLWTLNHGVLKPLLGGVIQLRNVASGLCLAAHTDHGHPILKGYVDQQPCRHILEAPEQAFYAGVFPQKPGVCHND